MNSGDQRVSPGYCFVLSSPAGAFGRCLGAVSAVWDCRFCIAILVLLGGGLCAGAVRVSSRHPLLQKGGRLRSRCVLLQGGFCPDRAAGLAVEGQAQQR
mmetsp:Transcript_50906/g.115686  ORF Transcript_50906/g.115686 Transcript_50906/m.115686 type:complete len:99 (-) Transcript_50906:37-333(-)